ncbi:MAG: type II/IV secretion system ATPase subunit [Candidatus Micrarchaeota archaeon]
MAQLEEYAVRSEEMEGKVTVARGPEDYVPRYSLQVQKLSGPTAAYLEDVKNELLKRITIGTRELTELSALEALKAEIKRNAVKLLKSGLPGESEDDYAFFASKIVQDMVGLGDLEFLIADDWLEEICVNRAGEPVWVYHRKYGWLKSNVIIPDEAQVRNYAAAIGRKVGRQITIQDPLLDANMVTGDRVNATLSPVSMLGNTITIRKFARKPWTITDMLKLNTLSYESAAFLWLCMEYEINILVGGGTGSGKTSFLNVLTAFMPASHRLVSIEQTHEIKPPKHLQWVPMVVREPTSEGKGEVSMLDLMINALRMRPDRIIVGEVRRADEAEVLFEAMHTGHSVYSTLHAETARETLKRLTHPPIDIPPVVLGSLQLIAVMYRDRRANVRRLFEVVELLPSEEREPMSRTLFRWKPLKDQVFREEASVRVLETLKTFTRMDEKEIGRSIAEKEEMLRWMVKKDVNAVDAVGKLVADYYMEPEAVLAKVRKK